MHKLVTMPVLYQNMFEHDDVLKARKKAEKEVDDLLIKGYKIQFTEALGDCIFVYMWRYSKDDAAES